MDDDPQGLAEFVARYGDDAAEAAWWAGLSLVERACARAKDGQFGRWRNAPRVELRRFRRDVAAGLTLARFAVALQESSDEAHRDLTRELEQEAAEAGRRRRREGTRAAEEARLRRSGGGPP